MSVISTIGKAAKSFGESVAPGLLPAVGSAVSGFLNRKSAKEQTAEAKRQYNESMSFNKYMAENAVQIRANDMLKAGMNPLLAAGAAAGGSASTPTAKAQQADYSGISQGAAATGELLADANLKRAQADNFDADTKTKLDELENEDSLRNMTIKEIKQRLEDNPKFMEQVGKEIEKLDAEIKAIGADVTREREKHEMEKELWVLEHARLQHNLKVLRSSGLHESQLPGTVSRLLSLIDDPTSTQDKIWDAMRDLHDGVIDRLPPKLGNFIRSIEDTARKAVGYETRHDKRRK